MFKKKNLVCEKKLFIFSFGCTVGSEDKTYLVISLIYLAKSRDMLLERALGPALKTLLVRWKM